MLQFESSVGVVEEVGVLEKIGEVDRVEVKVLIREEAHTLAGTGEWRVRWGMWIMEHWMRQVGGLEAKVFV